MFSAEIICVKVMIQRLASSYLRVDLPVSTWWERSQTRPPGWGGTELIRSLYLGPRSLQLRLSNDGGCCVVISQLSVWSGVCCDTNSRWSAVTRTLGGLLWHELSRWSAVTRTLGGLLWHELSVVCCDTNSRWSAVTRTLGGLLWHELSRWSAVTRTLGGLLWHELSVVCCDTNSQCMVCCDTNSRWSAVTRTLGGLLSH